MNEKQLIDFANAIIAQYYDGENGTKHPKNVSVWRYGIVELAKAYLQENEEIINE